LVGYFRYQGAVIYKYSAVLFVVFKLFGLGNYFFDLGFSGERQANQKEIPAY